MSGSSTNDPVERIKELEAEIDMSQERFRLVLSRLPAGLVIVRKDDGIEVANRVIESMFGYSRKQLGLKPISFLLPKVEKLVSEKAEFETLGKKADGNFFPVQIAQVETPTPEGVRTIVFITDISERRRLEKLRQDFVAMISHDIRSPLMNISGILELTSGGKFGDINNDGLDLLSKADRNLTRVIEMISELLDVERMEDGHMELDTTVGNLTDTAQEAISDVHRLAGVKHIEVSSWSHNVFANFDKARIHRVLVNLIANAIKFAPENSSIKLEHEQTREWIEIRVIDRGRGVPEDARELIFSKYGQTSTADATELGGTGLGLAICKAIIDAHHGTIGVRSNPDGPGSTFWFRLPCSEDEV